VFQVGQSKPVAGSNALQHRETSIEIKVARTGRKNFQVARLALDFEIEEVTKYQRLLGRGLEQGRKGKVDSKSIESNGWRIGKTRPGKPAARNLTPTARSIKAVLSKGLFGRSNFDLMTSLKSFSSGEQFAEQQVFY